MPCILALLAWFFPRLVIILLALTTDYLGRAFGTWVWPLLGFFFMPMTTLAAAFSINHGGGIKGIYIVLVVLAVLADLGLFSDGARRAKRRRRIDVVQIRRQS